MVHVVLQLPGPGIEDIDVRLARVPVKGDFLDFSEDYPDELLQGESYVVRSVLFPIDGSQWPEEIFQPPVVVAREP